MKFKTAYEFEFNSYEEVDPFSEVDSAGYVPTEKRILSMIQAGERLRLSGSDAYDYDEDVDDFDIDPTRSGSFDLVDGQRLVNELEEKKIAYEEALKASQTASDGSGEGSKTPPVVVSTPPAE